MKIKARLRSTCPLCNRPISVGSVVEWSPGVTAQHIDCRTDPTTGRRVNRYRARRGRP